MNYCFVNFLLLSFGESAETGVLFNDFPIKGEVFWSFISNSTMNCEPMFSVMINAGF